MKVQSSFEYAHSLVLGCCGWRIQGDIQFFPIEGKFLQFENFPFQNGMVSAMPDTPREISAAVGSLVWQSPTFPWNIAVPHSEIDTPHMSTHSAFVLSLAHLLAGCLPISSYLQSLSSLHSSSLLTLNAMTHTIFIFCLDLSTVLQVHIFNSLLDHSIWILGSYNRHFKHVQNQPYLQPALPKSYHLSKYDIYPSCYSA